MKHKENWENLQFSKPLAAMGAWLGRIAGDLVVDQQFCDAMQLLETRDRYLQIGEMRSARPGNNELEYGHDRIHGYLLVVTGPETTTIWACHCLQCYVYYLMK